MNIPRLLERTRLYDIALDFISTRRGTSCSYLVQALEDLELAILIDWESLEHHDEAA